MIQLRDYCRLHVVGGCKGSDKLTDFGSIGNVEMERFADRLDWGVRERQARRMAPEFQNERLQS